MRTVYTNGEKIAYFSKKILRLKAQIEHAEKRIEDLKVLPADEYTQQDFSERISSELKQRRDL